MRFDNIEMKPIGVIYTPYRSVSDGVPVQISGRRTTKTRSREEWLQSKHDNE